MSNLERNPAETLGIDASGSGIEILEPREVPLGGPCAITVPRTLPQRGRSLIGAWCFIDHCGPDDVTERWPRRNCRRCGSSPGVIRRGAQPS